jgi:hypothetical protein
MQFDDGRVIERTKGTTQGGVISPGLANLFLHPQKTKIVYCQDDRRKGHYHTTSFDFLGYTFRRRACRGRGRLFLGFSPAVSASALKSIRTKIRKSRIRSRTQVDLNAIAKELNPVIRGWLAYYGAFYRSEMYRFNTTCEQDISALGHAKVQIIAF